MIPPPTPHHNSHCDSGPLSQFDLHHPSYQQSIDLPHTPCHGRSTSWKVGTAEALVAMAEQRGKNPNPAATAVLQQQNLACLQGSPADNTRVYLPSPFLLPSLLLSAVVPLLFPGKRDWVVPSVLSRLLRCRLLRAGCEQGGTRTGT